MHLVSLFSAAIFSVATAISFVLLFISQGLGLHLYFLAVSEIPWSSPSVLLSMVLSVMCGINAALVAFTFRVRRAASRAAGGAAVGGLIAALSTGCLACSFGLIFAGTAIAPVLAVAVRFSVPLLFCCIVLLCISAFLLLRDLKGCRIKQKAS